ncbi:hypothetical protein N0B44_20685 [Roseibacterium beibuensis]|uniref:hypothetical protein n=1 Tax=[Roseibacterium] beibuensis TaxID=1193142 RepID=UPI00217D716F|nr:hypothetical protein [Roseibacterium beibuensis]MCS6625333.1 hypothetical protein [Roseibacterium beibuensis]
MPDPITVMSSLGAIKAALDITKTLSDARDSTKLLAVKLELQGLLLEALETQSALAGQKRELEEQVRQFETWDREKERYKLEKIGRGSFAYTLKAEAQGAEPPHMICPTCYQHGRKSILQAGDLIVGQRSHGCPVCKTAVAGNIPPLEPLPPGPAVGVV